jgi:hypothetical protein
VWPQGRPSGRVLNPCVPNLLSNPAADRNGKNLVPPRAAVAHDPAVMVALLRPKCVHEIAVTGHRRMSPSLRKYALNRYFAKRSCSRARADSVVSEFQAVPTLAVSFLLSDRSLMFSLVKPPFHLALGWTWLDHSPHLALHICSTTYVQSHLDIDSFVTGCPWRTLRRCGAGGR